MEISHTTTIAAPIERVWQLTIDLEALPSVTPTINRVERLDEGPVHVGTRARLEQPGLPPRVWLVEELDAPHRFSWATSLFGVRMVGVHDLEAVDDQRCRLTLRVVFEGRGGALLGRLSRRSLARTLATEAAGFARAATAVSA